MAFNNRNSAERKEFSEVEKAAYYKSKAKTEENPLIRQNYVLKGDFWDRKAQGLPVTPEEEAVYGKNHPMSAVDNLENARRWYENSNRAEKKEQWAFVMDYWTKKAQNQEVTPEEEAKFQMYTDLNARESAARKQQAGNRRVGVGGYKRGSTYDNNSIRQVNALFLANALSSLDFPAYGSRELPGDDGKIKFVPHSARNFGDGRPYDGINQLVLQAYAKKYSLRPEADGHFYFANRMQAGMLVDKNGKQVFNVKPGAKDFVIVTMGGRNVDGKRVSASEALASKGVDFDSLSDIEKAAAWRSVGSKYTLFSSSDIINTNFSHFAKDGGIEHNRPLNYNQRNDKVVVDASDAKTPAEYFGKYFVACHAGCQFVTTRETAAKIQEMTKKELEQAIANNRDGEVYQWLSKTSEPRQEEFDRRKAEHAAMRGMSNSGYNASDFERLGSAALGQDEPEEALNPPAKKMEVEY